MGDFSPMGDAAFVVPMLPVRSLEEAIGQWAEMKAQLFGGLQHQAAPGGQLAVGQL